MTSHQQARVSGTPVIDYEGSQYKRNFWEGQGRDYEDTTERVALRQLLPLQGPRIAEIGAGFGRLANMYLGYDQIILFDYSRTLLQDAVAHWGHDPRFVFVAGNIYQLPLATGSLDSLVMVRVMHHLADVPAALQQIHRVLHSQSVAVLEYANKRNLKAFLRWAIGRQSWSPLDSEPVEFVELNFDFHPNWMKARFQEARLSIKQQYAVSHFRLPLLKKYVGSANLVKADQALYGLGGLYPVSPSVFVQVEAIDAGVRAAANMNQAGIAELFCCPQCAKSQFQLVETEQLLCGNCGIKYNKVAGIWDFKEAATN